MDLLCGLGGLSRNGLRRVTMGQTVHVVGVDIGGTTIKAVAATSTGEVLSDVRNPTQRGSGEAILEGILETIGQAIDEALLAPADITAVGMGAPGAHIDRKLGTWAGSTTINLGMRAPLTSMVQERFGVPAYLDNDGNVAALGEMRFGAGSDVLDMIYITLGSGVGGAIIIDGQVHYGRGRTSGELGHIIVQRDGPLCGCGGHGCLEALASATAMIREARATLEAGEPTLIRELTMGDPGKLNGQLIARAAQQGDEVALRIWRDAGEAVGLAVVSLDKLLGPEVIVIGGALAQAGDILWEPMYETIAQASRQRLKRHSVRVAALGERTGLMGGVALALRQLENQRSGNALTSS
jgi:glucokinase